MNKSELKNGCVVETRNGTKYIKIDNTLVNFYIFKDKISCGWLKFDDYNEDLTFKKQFEEKEWDIMKVNNSVIKERYCFSSIHNAFNAQKDTWTWVREEKPKCILTDEEKAYLKAVITPVKDRVNFIQKLENNTLPKQFIHIELDKDYMILYYFVPNTQFKGMKLGRAYTLKELEL